MQRILLVAVCFFVSLLAHAQFEKGQALLGGSISGSVSNAENAGPTTPTKTSMFSVAPSLGWFTGNSTLVGFQLGYSHNYIKTEQPLPSTFYSKGDFNSYSVALFGERFIGLAKNFYFTVRGIAGVTVGAGENVSGSEPNIYKTETRQFYTRLGITPGLSYRFSPRWLLDLNLQNVVSMTYLHETQQPSVGSNKKTSNSFYFSSSLESANLGNVGVGFRFLLKK